MVGDGEAVGLITDPLEQLQHWTGLGDTQGLAGPWPEHQFLFLGQRRPFLLLQPQRLQGCFRGMELA